jgi:hypothetical protein
MFKSSWSAAGAVANLLWEVLVILKSYCRGFFSLTNGIIYSLTTVRLIIISMVSTVCNLFLKK